ncbi:MAG TPA: hypothetical protein VJB12_04555 [Candidatus Nanoarchaeia archaeon]|nr:hypothetical protein [Candidatus Nanoarchaeia archaeon]
MENDHALSYNPAYKNQETISQIRRAFSKNTNLPSVTLQKFFDESVYSSLQSAFRKQKFAKKVDRMHYRYSTSPLPKALKEILNNENFIALCSRIMGTKITRIEGALYSFGWRDYTLLHDEAMEQPGFDIIIDFTDSWPQDAGGIIVYVDGTWNYHHIPPTPNALSLTKREENVQKFVQYVNHKAGKKSRVLFLGTFRR